ncbi:hypothetical protein [Sphingobium sp. HDIP04]|uniref:hypothetical protein n=1 Tax=Sphingobium sp. HDIP04 TaxID=428994 RepID=UPI000387667D|nr:hypothetical protein [Sphingobium sp. HDIP04]EQB03894.1 hypothetical protein L286_11050 [Sphingobium sp. HDIP04]
MAHQWKAGDLARCINDCEDDGTPLGIVRGRIYRVINVFNGWDENGLPSFALNVGVIGTNGCDGFSADCFRPVLPAEPCFVEAMRSLKPRVEA